jgi:hypothetical protein
MTTYFVGPGGSDAASGTTWALRKLTLTGAEALALAGDDVVRVAPGTYRETHTTAHAGTSGHPITFAADVTGVNTDGVGGSVRITGSNNDQTATRSTCIACNHNYRTFRGFYLDTVTTQHILINACTNAIIEDCSLVFSGNTSIIIQGATDSGHIIRRCYIAFPKFTGIQITHTATINDTGNLIENCVTIVAPSFCIRADRIGGITVRNCTIIGGAVGVKVNTALAAGQTLIVNNCILLDNAVAVQATTLGELVEDYNAFFVNGTDRSTVNTGANSSASTPLLTGPQLSAGAIFTWIFGMLRSDSLLASIAGTGVATDDLYGTTRVATSSWGAVQYIAGQRPADAGQPRGRQS